MYEKTPYTPGFRNVVVLAHKIVRKHHATVFTPAHYLAGILRKGDGIAYQVLLEFGVDIPQLAKQVNAYLKTLPRSVFADPYPNVAGKAVLDRSKDFAVEMRQNWIGTEHLLLALVADHESRAGQLLREHGLELERTREMVILVQDGESPLAAQATRARGGKTRPPLWYVLLPGFGTVLLVRALLVPSARPDFYLWIAGMVVFLVGAAALVRLRRLVGRWRSNHHPLPK